MDIITIIGLVIGIVGIVGGMILEGGHLGSILQPTAAVIVLGGTFGAVMVGTTRKDLMTGLGLLKSGFLDKREDAPDEILHDLIEAARLARKDSILGLERMLYDFKNPFMQNVFRFVVDGVEPPVLREIFEAEIEREEDNLLAGAKIYIDAGGYAPTIGIIGAVLGLIHVMANLTDASKLGSGIAVAFVATIYGVGSANLLFLPLGSKIRRKIHKRMLVKTMILEGAIGILSGLNPFIIEQKLMTYLDDGRRAQSKAA